MSMTQLVHGKAVVVPEIVEGRNPFSRIYEEADNIMGRTDYIWCNRREISFVWNRELGAYLLELNDQVEGRKFAKFLATKSAIRNWALKANSTLSRDVWTIVTYLAPDDDIPTALNVLTDQYAILSYTDMLSSIEKVCNELATDRTTKLQRLSISPDFMTADLVMADLAIPTELQQVGDVLSVGVQVSSSLTGKAAVRIRPYCIRLSCLNRITTTVDGEDSGVKFVHKWGGMRYDIGDNPLNERNVRWLQDRASQKLGNRYLNSLRGAVFSNLEDSMNIVRGAAVSANTPLSSVEAPRMLSGIIDSWIDESPSAGVDFRKKDFDYFNGDEPRAGYIAAATNVLRQYSAQLGCSMYSVIQALTDRSTLLSLPDVARAAVEDWAARYCIKQSESYDPTESLIVNITGQDLEKILGSLKTVGA